MLGLIAAVSTAGCAALVLTRKKTLPVGRMDDRFGASQLAQHNETLQTSLDLAEALRQRHLHIGTY